MCACVYVNVRSKSPQVVSPSWLLQLWETIMDGCRDGWKGGRIEGWVVEEWMGGRVDGWKS